MKDKLIALLKKDGLTLAIVAILITVYAILRTPGDKFASAAELEAEIMNGQPTVIEFYANSCSICLTSKPKVDQLERDLVGGSGATVECERRSRRDAGLRVGRHRCAHVLCPRRRWTDALPTQRRPRCSSHHRDHCGLGHADQLAGTRQWNSQEIWRGPS